MTSAEIRHPEHGEMGEQMTELGDFNRPTEGYIVITPLTEEVKSGIATIQHQLLNHFPHSALWLPEGDQLHTTIARYRERLPLSNTQEALLGSPPPNLINAVTTLQLIQEHAMYTQSHTVLKEY